MAIPASDHDFRFGLPAHAVQRLCDQVARYPVEKAIIYGSRAKGNYRQGSDIDLTLIAPDMTSRQLLQLEQAIDDLLLPWKVDLSLYHQIDNPSLMSHIQRVGRPLC